MEGLTARRIVALWIVPGLLMAVIVVPQSALAHRLPDPLAVHWAAGGEPNGSMGAWWSLGLIAGMWAVAWVGLAVAGRGGVLPPALVVGFTYFLGALLAAVQVSIVERNLDATTWLEAGRLAWWVAVAILVVAVAGGISGWLLGEDASRLGEDRRRPGRIPSAGLEAGAEAHWSGAASARWPAAAALLPLAAIPFLPGAWRWLPIAVAIPIALLSSVRATASEGGFVVGLGWWGWPSRRILLADIDHAEALDDVRPIAYGGWGYRMTREATAVVVRRGPGIRIVRDRGRDFIVTIDDHDRGAGTVNDLVTRRMLGGEPAR